jgi:hypothetical protein
MAQPTPQHELLKKDVGTWDATMRMWFTPNAEPLVSNGIENNKLLDGGLWLISHYEGKIADTRFVGCGTVGFDPVKQKYVGTWIDNVTSSLSVMEGDYDQATNTLTMISRRRDPHTGQSQTTKSTLQYVDNDTRIFEFLVPDADGKYWKMLEIKYVRRTYVDD